jgi:hypothetical protein
MGQKKEMESRKKRRDTLGIWRWRGIDMVISIVNLCLCVKYRNMNACAGVEVWRHAFLKSTLCGRE